MRWEATMTSLAAWKVTREAGRPPSEGGVDLAARLTEDTGAVQVVLVREAALAVPVGEAALAVPLAPILEVFVAADLPSSEEDDLSLEAVHLSSEVVHLSTEEDDLSLEAVHLSSETVHLSSEAEDLPSLEGVRHSSKVDDPSSEEDGLRLEDNNHSLEEEEGAAHQEAFQVKKEARQQEILEAAAVSWAVETEETSSAGVAVVVAADMAVGEKKVETAKAPKTSCRFVFSTDSRTEILIPWAHFLC
jgi:hypothetical protein